MLLPPWPLTVNNGGDYETGLDQHPGPSGLKPSFIRVRNPPAGGFGTICQSLPATKYLGKRIRFSALVKTSDVNRAQLWLRIDSCEQTALRFDNMKFRPITGNNDWQKYECILDVPTESNLIVAGLILATTGQAWIDSGKIEIVGIDVPTTDSN
jgi:hypothetical protein